MTQFSYVFLVSECVRCDFDHKADSHNMTNALDVIQYVSSEESTTIGNNTPRSEVARAD